MKNFLSIIRIVALLNLHWQTRSHAERGESFQNQDFVGGMQNRRRFAPTIFLVLKPFSKNCGIHCTKFECILKATLTPINRTRGARGGLKLPRTLVSFRHCLAEPRQPRKKNTPCFSYMAVGEF